MRHAFICLGFPGLPRRPAALQAPPWTWRAGTAPGRPWPQRAGAGDLGHNKLVQLQGVPGLGERA